MINKKLRTEILIMYADDQDMLMGVRLREKYDSSIDERNTLKMKKIVKRYGWPTYDLVGYTSSNAAWVIVQHADKDLVFQKHCLKLIKKKVKSGQASLENLAYLTDRILVNSGKEQLYGTQFYLNQRGEYEPRPIKDEKNLEKRRRKIGLEAFKLYRQRMNKIYRNHPV